MIAALLPLLGIHSAFIMGFTSHPQAAFARPTEATHQWLSPSLRRGDEVIYMSGPNGVYIYRRHPALKLAGFLLVQENVVTAGPAIGPNHDLYVVNFNSSTEASVVDEITAPRGAFGSFGSLRKRITETPSQLAPTARYTSSDSRVRSSNTRHRAGPR